jgi:hypothetical protein
MTGTRAAPPPIAAQDASIGLRRQQPLVQEELALRDAYWRAANYPRMAQLRGDMVDERVRAHIRQRGEDPPEISASSWPLTTALGG